MMTAAPPRERAVLATAALGTTLAPLNSTMIAVALPAVMRDLDTGVATAAWLVTGYLIAMAALQPVAGKLGDRFGRRRLVLAGLVYFGLASLGATVASNLPLLIAFRVQQAIAGAIALPNATAIVREVLPTGRRASGYGLIGGAAGLAAALGPPLGGVLVDAFGWRSIFFANVPLVAAALLLGWRYLPRTAGARSAAAFDWGGALLLSALLLGLTGLLTVGVRALDAVGLAAAAAALLALALLFVRRELAHPDPLLRPALLAHRGFAAASGAVATSNMAMYATLLTVPMLLSERAGWTSAQVGVALSTLSVGMAVFTPIGGRLADRLGRRWTTVAGLALLTLGALPMALLGPAMPVASLLASLGVVGVGLGLSSAPMQTAAVESVAAEETGAASGVFSTSRYLGSIAASIVLAALAGAEGGVFVAVFLAAAASLVVSLGLRDWPTAAPAVVAPAR
jgi:EmrB/QacA subfamily drug resistance transporter